MYESHFKSLILLHCERSELRLFSKQIKSSKTNISKNYESVISAILKNKIEKFEKIANLRNNS